MLRLYLFLFFCGFVVTFNGAAAEESVSKDVNVNPQAPEAVKVVPIEQHQVEQPKPIVSSESLSTPLHVSLNYPRYDYWPFYHFYNPYLYFNPLNNVNSEYFKNVVARQFIDLKNIRDRQNHLLKYAECSCPNSEKCQKVNQPDGTEEFKSVYEMSREANKPEAAFVTYDKFNAAMNEIKNAIQKLALRQNVVYEFIECSCTVKAECAPIKPVLNALFASNTDETRGILQNFFFPGGFNAPNSFFQSLASFLNQIPSWFTFNFNPLANPFFNGYQPFYTPPFTASVPSSSSTSGVSSSSSSSPQTIQSPQTAPTTSYVGGSSSGGQPVFSSSSTFSSTSGSGEQVSGGHVSTSEGGKPTEEHYFVSSNGENVHISSSSGGSGVSSPKISGSRRRRYVIDPRLNPVEVGILQTQAGVQAGLAAVQQGVILVQQGVQAGVVNVQQGLAATLG